jgi:hypothetical protein
VGTGSLNKQKGANRRSVNPFYFNGSAGHTAVRTFHQPYYSNIKGHLEQIKRYTYKQTKLKSLDVVNYELKYSNIKITGPRNEGQVD